MPRSSLSKFAAGDHDVERIRRHAWREHGAVTVPVTDDRLQPAEKLVLESIGTRLYGPRKGA